MLTHRRHERSREIGAHFPQHPLAAPVFEDECVPRRFGELAGPGVELRLTGSPRQLIERVHPLREVVEVLTVTFPLDACVVGFGGLTLRQRFPDTQSAARRMRGRFHRT